MSPDLRRALTDAAGRMEDLPDLHAITERARGILWRRRLARVGVASIVVALIAAGSNFVDLRSSAPLEPVTPPRLEGRPLPSSGALIPATYAVRGFEHPFSFRVASQGWLVGTEHATWVYLTSQGVNVHVQLWDRVFSPTARSVKRTEFDAIPQDLVAWLAEHPRVITSNEMSVQIGDLHGTRVDVVVRQPLSDTPPECEGTRCAVLAGIRDLPELVDVRRSEIARIYVLDGYDEPIVIHWQTDAGRFAATEERMDEMVASIRFAP